MFAKKTVEDALQKLDILEADELVNARVRQELLSSLVSVTYNPIPSEPYESLFASDPEPSYTTSLSLHFDPAKLEKYPEGEKRERAVQLMTEQFKVIAREQGIDLPSSYGNPSAVLKAPLSAEAEARSAEFLDSQFPKIDNIPPKKYDLVDLSIDIRGCVAPAVDKLLYKDHKWNVGEEAPPEALAQARQALLAIPQVKKIADFADAMNKKITAPALLR